METDILEIARRAAIDRVIYATITIMSALVIYDGWQHLRLVDVAGVIVGPIVAMFLAHVFSAAMARHIEVGRILHRRGWAAVPWPPHSGVRG